MPADPAAVLTAVPRALLGAALCLALAAPGCARAPKQAPPPAEGEQVAATTAETDPAVGGTTLAMPLATGKLALLTPTTVWGREETRQALALRFAELLGALRPDLPALPLSKTLSAINAQGLAAQYDAMYATYRNTGLFDRALLEKIGAATGARYLVQIKLGAFDQANKTRFAWLGVSLLQTQSANVNLLVQIWDSTDGTIVWERSAEASRVTHSVRERPITFREAIEEAAVEAIRAMPR